MFWSYNLVQTRKCCVNSAPSCHSAGLRGFFANGELQCTHTFAASVGLHKWNCKPWACGIKKVVRKVNHRAKGNIKFSFAWGKIPTLISFFSTWLQSQLPGLSWLSFSILKYTTLEMGGKVGDWKPARDIHSLVYWQFPCSSLSLTVGNQAEGPHSLLRSHGNPSQWQMTKGWKCPPKGLGSRDSTAATAQRVDQGVLGGKGSTSR